MTYLIYMFFIFSLSYSQIYTVGEQISKIGEAIGDNLEEIVETDLLPCHCKCCKAANAGPTTHVQTVEEEVAAAKIGFLDTNKICFSILQRLFLG